MAGKTFGNTPAVGVPGSPPLTGGLDGAPAAGEAGVPPGASGYQQPCQHFSVLSLSLMVTTAGFSKSVKVTSRWLQIK